MTTIRVAHRLSRTDLRERFERLLAKHKIAVTPAGEDRGTIEKAIPFAGKVRASYELQDGAVELELLETPAFPSQETIRRMVTEELERLLAGA